MTTTLVLDVDGTLVDTNYYHTIAWHRAFKKHDISVPCWRLHRAIGMGGDQLVEAVSDKTVEQKYGSAIRDAWKQEADRLLDEVRPLAGAHDLLAAAVDQGFTVVLASSGKPDHVDHYLDLLQARSLAASWTTSEDVEKTKPAPDLLAVALEKVDGGPAVTVGDSVWDCEAAGRLGIPVVGVRTGGFSESELREHGAAAVYDGPVDLVGVLGSLPVAQSERHSAERE